MSYEKKLRKLLELAIEKKASDIHISVPHPPILRINGNLMKIPEEKGIDSEEAKNLAFVMMSESQREWFLEHKEIDFSFTINNKARFRVNIFMQRGDVSCTMRLIPSEVRSLEELNLPESLYKFSEAHQGFVLVTGPASHGKSTTLAALIDRINRTRFDHIVTIEDPIEYVFQDDRSLINQREIDQDAISFSKALKSVFRQDPDVIMVGEMRDPETISTAITAAETGHLVFSTLHTNSASQTVHRIIDSFPADQQHQISAQLSASLLGVISQRLVPAKGGGLIPAYEIMTNTFAVSNLIRKNKIHEVDAFIETSTKDGMISLNRCLANLVSAGRVTAENALAYSLNPEALEKLIK